VRILTFKYFFRKMLFNLSRNKQKGSGRRGDVYQRLVKYLIVDFLWNQRNSFQRKTLTVFFKTLSLWMAALSSSHNGHIPSTSEKGTRLFSTVYFRKQRQIDWRIRRCQLTMDSHSETALHIMLTGESRFRSNFGNFSSDYKINVLVLETGFESWNSSMRY